EASVPLLGFDDLLVRRPPLRQLDHVALIRQLDVQVEFVKPCIDTHGSKQVADVLNGFNGLADAERSTLHNVAARAPGTPLRIKELLDLSERVPCRGINGDGC